MLNTKTDLIYAFLFFSTSIISVIFFILVYARIKVRSAFNYNVTIILALFSLYFYTRFTLFLVAAVIFLIFLPACSKREKL